MQIVPAQDLGFSAERLERITMAIQGWVDQSRIAGAVMLVARHGRPAYFQAAGWQDVAAGTPMAPDTIFRIFSMTKPITCCAALMLYEEGRFLLDQPVADFVPEFASSRVFAGEGPDGALLAELERPITLRHLFMHTSGLIYPSDPSSPLSRLWQAAQVSRSDETLAQKAARLAGLPLLHQPGAAWTYGMSHDVLGRVVEVASGCRFEDFLRERIFAPLGMPDTAFFLPPEKGARLAAAYNAGVPGRLTRIDTPEQRQAASVPPVGPSPGGGLFSTAADYARFCQMLLNGGQLDGVRLLAPRTVRLMASDHLHPAPAPLPHGVRAGLTDGWSFGLGVEVLVNPARFGIPAGAGSFSWTGAASTYFWIDPQEDLFGIVLPQVFPLARPLFRLFPQLVYQALVD